MKVEPKIHFGAGVRTPDAEFMPGYPCCCSGAPAIRARKLDRCTTDANAVTCRQCMDVIDRAIGGPHVCSRECSECTPRGPGFFGQHHFADIVETADDDPNHPAATIFSRDAWYRCKHCVAWALDETTADT